MRWVLVEADRTDPARGRRRDGQLHRRAAPQPVDGGLARHPSRIVCRRPRRAVRRPTVRCRHDRVDGRGEGQPGGGRDGATTRRQGPDPVRCRPARRRVRRRLGGRRQRGRSRPRVEDPGCDLQPERTARRASGEGAGAKRSPGDRRRPTPGVPPSPRRFGGQPRAAQGRRSGVRHQAQGLSGVVHASHVPPVAGADPQPQGPRRSRLDARACSSDARSCRWGACTIRPTSSAEPRAAEDESGADPAVGMAGKGLRYGAGVADPQVILPTSPILSLDDYLAAGGGTGIRAARELGREATLSEVTASGLRGRGGGGFPTGDKWRSVRDAGGGRRYVVANGAEGEPATFKDRTLMRRDPFRIIEGAAIAAFVVGAADVYVATKRSFTRESENLRRAAVELGGAGTPRGVDGHHRGGSGGVSVRRGKGVARGHRGSRPTAAHPATVATRLVRDRVDGLGSGDVTGGRRAVEQPDRRQQRRDTRRGRARARQGAHVVPHVRHAGVAGHDRHDGRRRRAASRCARGRARHAVRRVARALRWSASRANVQGRLLGDLESGAHRR